MIDTVWLTINRVCNFRCLWCYAEDTKYLKAADMPLALAKELVDFSKELGVKNILLIGGEPTYYPFFFEIVNYVNSQDIYSILVTNGYRFKDKKFLEETIRAGLNAVYFSIKAANAQQQKELTLVDAFEDIEESIKNLVAVKNRLKIGYSTVISKDTLNNIEEFAKFISSLDETGHLTYSMCNPIFDATGNVSKDYVCKPADLINTFISKYDEIVEYLGDQIFLEQSLPYCLWPREFIEKLRSKQQASFGCHLQRRNGLVFDSDGNVIVCNSLPEFKVGRYGIDFVDRKDFIAFWESEKLMNLYNKIYEYPSKNCKTCAEYVTKCGGGCPLKWFVYNAKKLIEKS